MSKLQEFIKFIEPAFKDITLAEGTKLTQSYASSTAKITAKCKICGSVYGPSQAKNVKCKTPGCDISTLKILDLYKAEERVPLKETLKAMGKQKHEAQQAIKEQMRKQIETVTQEMKKDNYDYDQEGPKTINVEDLIEFLKTQQHGKIDKDMLVHNLVNKFNIPEHRVFNKTFDLEANSKNEYRVFKEVFEKSFLPITPIEDKQRLTTYASMKDLQVMCLENSHTFFVTPEVIPMLTEHGCPFCVGFMDEEDLEAYQSSANKLRAKQFSNAQRRMSESSNKVIRKTVKTSLKNIDKLDSIIAKAKQANAERVAAEEQAQEDMYYTPDEAVERSEQIDAHKQFYRDL